MNTKKIASAFAVAFALGFAAPAIADDPGGDPGIAVEQLTIDLVNQAEQAGSTYVEEGSDRS